VRVNMGSPPGFADFVPLRQPPCRGRRQRPGKASSAASAGRCPHASRGSM